MCLQLQRWTESRAMDLQLLSEPLLLPGWERPFFMPKKLFTNNLNITFAPQNVQNPEIRKIKWCNTCPLITESHVWAAMPSFVSCRETPGASGTVSVCNVFMMCLVPAARHSHLNLLCFILYFFRRSLPEGSQQSLQQNDQPEAVTLPRGKTRRRKAEVL